VFTSGGSVTFHATLARAQVTRAALAAPTLAARIDRGAFTVRNPQ
jgi:hypothetical protein